ncbi:hypothetical protein ACQEV4_12770 [Streptomyces shenzhenensis]
MAGPAVDVTNPVDVVIPCRPGGWSGRDTVNTARAVSRAMRTESRLL